MKLLYALLCDNAFLSIDRKVNIIGVFETINAQKFPVVHPKFVIVGSIEPSKRNFKMSLNIIGEDEKPILGDIQEREVDLPAEAKGQNFNFIIEVINTNFIGPGAYRVQVAIDGKVIGEVPFKVLESKMGAVGAPS